MGRIMIRRTTLTANTIVNLDGPDGNAFALLGFAERYMGGLGIPREDIDDFLDEMKSGDYIHLVKTLDGEFGADDYDYTVGIIFETTNEDLL